MTTFLCGENGSLIMIQLNVVRCALDDVSLCIANGCQVVNSACAGPPCARMGDETACLNAGCQWEDGECSGPACASLSDSEYACNLSPDCRFKGDSCIKDM